MHACTFRSAAVAVAAVLAAPVAFATATGTASINVLSWTLTDLNTGDGITPSFVTTNGQSYSSVSLANSNTSFFQSVQGTYQPTSATGSNVYGSGTASTSATGGSATATAKGSSIAGTTQYNFATAEPFYVNFTLSPNTLVIVNATVTLSASTTRAYTGNGLYETVNSYAYLYEGITDAVTGNTLTNAYASRSTYASYLYNSNTQSYLPESTANNGPVQLIFANQTSSPVTGYLYGYASVQAASSYLAAVPENDTLTLMAAGLLATGALVRRRQRWG